MSKYLNELERQNALLIATSILENLLRGWEHSALAEAEELASFLEDKRKASKEEQK